MAHPTYKTAGGATRSRKGTGAAGTDGDPDVFYEVIQAIEAGASPDLDTANASLASIDATTAANLLPPGQAVMADSSPVTIASDQTPVKTVNTGVSWVQAILATSSADLTSIADISPAPSSGEHLVMESVSISAAVAMVVTLTEQTSGTVVKVFNLTSGNLNAEWNPTNGLRLPTADKKLRATSDTAGQVDISVISHSAV